MQKSSTHLEEYMPQYTRRQFLRMSTSGAVAIFSGALGFTGCGKSTSSLEIALDEALSSWDPYGVNAVDRFKNAAYHWAVFGGLVHQARDRSLLPGILSDWGWNEDRNQIYMSVRENALWHDGSPVTPEDVVWSIKRAASHGLGAPMTSIWNAIDRARVLGNTVLVDVAEYDPVLFRHLASTSTYVLPERAFSEMSPEEWERHPVGSGPYMVKASKKGRYVELKSFKGYWGEKPDFESVILKMMPERSDRLSEFETGSSELIVGPVDSGGNQKKSASPIYVQEIYPTPRIGLIMLTNTAPIVRDRNVRLAMHHAINKEVIARDVLADLGFPIHSLQVPEGLGYDPSIDVRYDPDAARRYLSASGYSKVNPAKITIQTKAFSGARDHDIVMAVVSMWREIGVEAEIEEIDSDDLYKLRVGYSLAPAAFFEWANPSLDPFFSTGVLMHSSSPYSTFKSPEVDRLLSPVFNEHDNSKRIAGYQKVDLFIAQEALIIPLVQYRQTLLRNENLVVDPTFSESLSPHNVKRVEACVVDSDGCQ